MMTELNASPPQLMAHLPLQAALQPTLFDVAS